MSNSPLLTVLISFLIFCLLFQTGLCEGAGDDNFRAIELYNLAVDKASERDFLQAAQLCDQALEIQPNFSLALITRAGAYLELNEVEKAEKSVQRALQLDPEDPSVLTAAASVSLRRGDDSGAISYADAALFTDPALVEAWIIKGTAHGNRGEYESEKEASEQALRLSPRNELAITNRDYAEEMMDKTRQAPSGVWLLFFSIGVSLLIIRRK